MNASHLDASCPSSMGEVLSWRGRCTTATTPTTPSASPWTRTATPSATPSPSPRDPWSDSSRTAAASRPTQSGTLCGARGAYLHDHYLYVAATQVDTISVVDVYRPDMPTVAGSVTHPKVLKGVVATWMHRSGEYVVAVARGRRPEGFGHVVLLDVRYVSFIFVWAISLTSCFVYLINYFCLLTGGTTGTRTTRGGIWSSPR
jgi:hypothetical protein